MDNHKSDGKFFAMAIIFFGVIAAALAVGLVFR